MYAKGDSHCNLQSIRKLNGHKSFALVHGIRTDRLCQTVMTGHRQLTWFCRIKHSSSMKSMNDLDEKRLMRQSPKKGSNLFANDK